MVQILAAMAGVLKSSLKQHQFKNESKTKIAHSSKVLSLAQTREASLVEWLGHQIRITGIWV